MRPTKAAGTRPPSATAATPCATLIDAGVGDGDGVVDGVSDGDDVDDAVRDGDELGVAVVDDDKLLEGDGNAGTARHTMT